MSTFELPEQELELTYLARKMPQEANDVEPVKMLDVYVPEDPLVHSRLRLRQKGSKYEITKKMPVEGEDASVHNESTIEIDQNEFETLAPSSKKRIEKDRYITPIEGRPAEIDVFRGVLAGLVLIDFEFDNHEDKESFVPPAVCLADVTQEDFIAGGQLAGKTYEDIEPELNRFNYTRLQ